MLPGSKDYLVVVVVVVLLLVIQNFSFFSSDFYTVDPITPEGAEQIQFRIIPSLSGTCYALDTALISFKVALLNHDGLAPPAEAEAAMVNGQSYLIPFL